MRNRRAILVIGAGAALVAGAAWLIPSLRQRPKPNEKVSMQQAVTELFQRYARETNAALAGKADLAAVSDLYTDSFIAAVPAGVMTGQKDDAFRKMLEAGFARYRKIGTQRMEVRNLRIEPIDDLHGLARVEWRATYDVEGTDKAIDFANVYLTRIEQDRAVVFGWITGDEEAELKKHGITG